MRKILILILLTSCTQHESLPLQDGQYTFTHQYAEQPNMPSIKLVAVIEKGNITLTNNAESSVFPQGVVEAGALEWHVSQQWIITSSPTDINEEEVGGCSGGPTVVDLEKLIYWTC